MKQRSLLHTGGAVLLGLCVAAALPVRAASAPGPKARLFAKYDTNKNGVIDGDEVAVVRQAFAADPKGEFARYDTNQDGKLSDEEIAGIKPPGGKKGGKSDGNSPAKGKKSTTEAKPASK